MKTIKKAGIYDIPFEDYRRDPCPSPSLRKGAIKQIVEQSAAHAFVDHARYGNKKHEPNRRGEEGIAYHALLLGDADRLHTIRAKTKAGRVVRSYKSIPARRERTDQILAGKTPILAHRREEIKLMVAAARIFYRHTGIKIKKTEQTIAWEEDGVWFLARADILDEKGRVVYDPKSSDDADPLTWARRTIYAGAYDIQAALITRGLERITGKSWTFVFLPQEMTPPYGIARLPAGLSMIALANAKIDRAKAIWAHCQAKDKWPRYGYEDRVIEAPRHQYREWKERERMRGQTLDPDLEALMEVYCG